MSQHRKTSSQAKRKTPNFKDILSTMLNYVSLAKAKLYIVFENDDELLVKSRDSASYKSTRFPSGKTRGRERFTYKTTNALLQHINTFRKISSVVKLILVNDEMNKSKTSLIVWSSTIP